MLAGTQQSVELKLALDQEQQKSKKLEESMRKLDEEMRRTDELLYQVEFWQIYFTFHLKNHSSYQMQN